MATVSTSDRELARVQTRELPSAGRPRPSSAVRLWAAIGAAILAFQTYVIVRWVSGPYFTRVHTGPTPVPDWMKTIQMTMMIVGFPLAALVVYLKLVRPLRRERRLTTDAMLMGVWLLMVFQDPLGNYSGSWYVYNSYLPNLGSWTASIPGWMPTAHPGAMNPEPLLWIAPSYLYVLFLGTVAGGWAMGRIRARRPDTQTWKLVAACWVFMVGLDVVAEGFIFNPVGLWSYAGAAPSLSLNAGHYYQYPLYYGVIWGSAWTALTCMRYFKNDMGQTFVERGAEAITGSEGRRGAVRFLALFGGASTIFFAMFTLPAQWIGTHSSAWPRDVQSRSYLVNGSCGEHTNTACPGPGVPLTRGNDSIRLGPDGKLYVPPGVKVPQVVPLARGTKGP
jgi:Spirocyclase AveC-like